jgi:predicted nucleic acid-binding protein
MTDVFLDTSYFVALSNPRDQHHATARHVFADLQHRRIRLVTTRGVILEIGNAMSRQHLRAKMIDFLTSLETDESIEVVEISQDLFEAGAEMFRDHADKEWSLTDCLSFVVMRDLGIDEALTFDHHFRQAGFRPLLASSGS